MTREERLRRNRAFTLIELLTACTIAVLVLTLALQIFSATTDLWQHSAQRSDTFREARAALDLMARDLRMTLPAEGAPMLKIGYETPEEDRTYEEIYAITSLPDPGKPSLCGIGYRCVWDEDARCYVLKRSFREAGNILSAMEEASNDFTKLLSQTDAHEEEAARYIWDLTFRPCEEGAAAKIYPDRTYSNALPLWIEIRFKALGPTAAAKLGALPINRETWSKPADPLYAKHILPYQQQFSVRVRLYAAADAATE
jgi:type II secretory pathway pseudopilin PulG